MQTGFLPTEDADISKEMQTQLAKKGITIITGAKVTCPTHWRKAIRSAFKRKRRRKTDLFR
jgi:pyruvate/2-oxoglutarate dehydrogenase complex dihydrolipoamide dehydrogenase (E3) component